MTKRGFRKRLALGAILVLTAGPPAMAQQSEDAQKTGKPINIGDVLSGELSALHLRSMKPGESAYQITSEPRRLPPPSGLCNLETGPETFQLMTSSRAQAAQLKGLLGKQIAVKVDAVACAQDATEISEAVVTKWSLVKR
jgi:conjugal transfer/entry exclusion protein